MQSPSLVFSQQADRRFELRLGASGLGFSRFDESDRRIVPLRHSHPARTQTPHAERTLPKAARSRTPLGVPSHQLRHRNAA
jgi:hypothetical protein